MGEKHIESLWDIKDLMAFTKIPKTTLMLYVAREQIPSIKIGRHRRFIPDDVRKALKKLP